jgi:methyltransferase-like protein
MTDMTDLTPPATNAYDDMPYPGTAQAESHPDRLATLALLHGMTPAAPDRCRVLELGCSDGGNLIPIAYGLPDSQFLGLDFSAREIATGQQRIASFGLNNVTLRQMNILEAGPELGQFDYILACGVYSWLAPNVQEKLLELSQQLLAPNGVAYINYNTYPGWFLRGMVRAILLHHTRNIAVPSQRVGESRALLEFLCQASQAVTGKYAVTETNRGAYSAALLYENAVVKINTDTYIYHEHLEAYNEPLYFSEFVQRAKQHGLQYLAEAQYSISQLENLPPDVADTIRRLTSDPIEQEQYVDFVVSRTFRQTLLCHQSVTLRRPPAPESLFNLSVASPVVPESSQPDWQSTADEQFRSPRGVKLTVGNPVAKTALMILAERWPQPVPFDELLALARARLRPGAPAVYSAERLAHDAQGISELLLRSFASELVELHVCPPRYVTQISPQPEASLIARELARVTRTVINLRHETVNVEDEASYRLLPLLDGGHDRAALLDQMVQMARSGQLIAQAENGRPFKDSATIELSLAAAIDRALHQLANAALLIA